MTAQATRRVSVIIGTRDRPTLLREAIKSIRAIEGPDLTFEILVGDNGTVPETAAVASEFGATYAKTDKNGCAAARNLALRRATGEFVAFLDDDDLWLPHHIRPHLALLDAHPEYEAVVGQIISTDPERRPLGEPWPSKLPADGNLLDIMMSGYFPQVGGTVVRTRAIAKHGLMDESLIGDSDWDWQLRIARSHKIGFAPVPCVLFRQRPPGSFDELQRMRMSYTRRIFFRHAIAGQRYSPLRIHRAYTGALWQFYQYFSTKSVAYTESGDWSNARRAAFSAFSALPVFTVKQLLAATPLRSAVLSSFSPFAKLKSRRTT